MPSGVVLAALKAVMIYMGLGAVFLADVTLLNPDTAVGAVFAMAIGAVVVWRVIRSNVIGYYRDEAKSAKDETESERERRQKAEMDANEQRELKHRARNDMASMQLKTDLTPLLQRMTELLEGQSARAELEVAMGADIKRLAAANEGLAERMADLAEGQLKQTETLTELLLQQTPPDRRPQ